MESKIQFPTKRSASKFTASLTIDACKNRKVCVANAANVRVREKVGEKDASGDTTSV